VNAAVEDTVVMLEFFQSGDASEADLKEQYAVALQ